MKIIAIHGEMGAGKDTVGAMLAEMLRDGDQEMAYKQSFALTVKENISNMTGIEMVDVNAPYANIVKDFTREQKEMYLEDWGMTLGKMMQVYATEAVRDNLHPDAWILSMKPKLTLSGVNIITDLRFQNEIDWLTSVNGVKIKIIRNVEELKDGRDKSHASERGLADEHFDFIIINNGTLKSLRRRVGEIYWKMRTEYLHL